MCGQFRLCSRQREHDDACVVKAASETIIVPNKTHFIISVSTREPRKEGLRPLCAKSRLKLSSVSCAHVPTPA